MITPKEFKRRLRGEALARRDRLDPAWRIEAALGMAERAGEIGVEPGSVVSGFWPIRAEVDVRPRMFALREQGARLALPAILDRETIVFRELVRGAPLVEMGFGTAGPGEEAEILDPALMLVPLAAFDARGHRVGYGGGYYDRAIERLRAAGHAPRLIGVAFDCQEVERVPDEGHDIVLPEMLTESGLRRMAPLGTGPGRHLLFVFGTLKKGFPLHDKGLAEATFLGTARTLHPYPMFVAGPWFAPMMVAREGEGQKVVGELYEVDDVTLARLDRLESVGKPGNFRTRLPVEQARDGQTVEAHAYVKAEELATPRLTGYLQDYQDRRFVPPWDRGKDQESA
jgi:5-formyltetrahydrofolate cyclo-ligase